MFADEKQKLCGSVDFEKSPYRKATEIMASKMNRQGHWKIEYNMEEYTVVHYCGRKQKDKVNFKQLRVERC